MSSSFACPNCGTQVTRGAAACRECGSDASTGWSESDEHVMPEEDLKPKSRSLVDLRFAMMILALISGYLVSIGLNWGPIAVAVLATAYFVHQRWKRRPARLAERQMRELVSKCHGDADLAERLVAGEAKRTPNAGRHVHVARALESLVRDRGR